MVQNLIRNIGIETMELHGLSKNGLERVLSFEGYGNKAADYWFLGIEEGGGSIEQLRLRAKFYDVVEDLDTAHRKIGLRDEMLKSPTLKVMSKLSLALLGRPNWSEKSAIDEFHATELGRSGEDTFLTELMPLPCPNIKAWPYESICSTKEVYTAMVRPGRIRWLRSEIEKFQPAFVICYGKMNWRFHQEIFSDVEFRPHLDDSIRVGKHGHSTVLLIPFLSYDLTTTTLIKQISELLGDGQNSQ